jgi:predicted flap endonuclease-1-like 5' DNA nuclease
MIGGGLAAGGSLGAAGLESSAASKAAATQANAADYAARIQGDLGQESLQNEVNTQEQNQANEEPFLQTGANSLASLGYLLGIAPGATVGGGTARPGQSLTIPGVSGTVDMPGVTPLVGTGNTNLGTFGSLMQQYPGGQFTAPTAAQAAATPGYQFTLNQGEGAVQAGASANGSLLTGGTLNAENQFGQGLASTNYNNTYNQALQSYNTNYNTWANNQANQFNRLAAIAGMGQTTAQTLGNQGITSAGQVANTLTNTGAQLGQDYQNAGAATASGYMGAANAWGGGITGATNSLSQMMMLQQLMQNNQNPVNGNPQFNSNGMAGQPGGAPYASYVS